METGHHGGFFHGTDAVPPRTQELVGAGLLLHQHALHADEGLFPELGRLQAFLSIGDGGGGEAGGEDCGSRRDAPDDKLRAPPRQGGIETGHHGGFLHGDDAVPPRTQELVGAVVLHHQHALHADEGLFPEPGRLQPFLNIGDGGDGDAGGEDRGSRRDAPDDKLRTPPRQGIEKAHHGGFLHGADAEPPRTQEFVGAFLHHHHHVLHADEGLFPEPGRLQPFLNIGDGGDGDAGGEDRGSRRDARAAPRSLWLWSGDAAGREVLGGRLDADEVRAAYRTLRLRGGAAAADDDSDGVPPPSHSWVGVMGLPMVQTVPGTCALVAATVCIEARHRRKFEHTHGPESFPCRAAAPRKLRRACYHEKKWNPSTRKHERTWDPVTGAWSMGRVLTMMKRLGGARTTNAKTPAPFFLPLKDWERYSYKDGGLTAETAVRLLYKAGPCIGTLFATPEFFDNFAILGSNRPPAVYRGCGREDREEQQMIGRGTMHAVVCFAYDRSKKGRLCIQILDSQRGIGPVRWVDFDEFDAFYVLNVQAMSSVHLLDFNRFPPLVYPKSEYR